MSKEMKRENNKYDEHKDLIAFEKKYNARITDFLENNPETRIVFLNADFGWGKTTFIKDNLKIKDFNINRYDANALKFSVVKLVPSADKSTLFRNFGSLMFTRIYHVDTICKTYLYNVARSTESEINIFDYISFEDKI